MTAISPRTAYDEITGHIAKQSGAYSDWYCGITSNIETRLHGDHNVPKKDHWFMYRECASSNDARAVEKALLEQDCDGAGGGGDESSVFVYAYLKTYDTNP